MNKILIIDDCTDLCDVLVRNLSEEGYKINSVNTGKEGIEELKRDLYNLIILDLKLPDMFGVEVLKEINSKYPDISVIILTGYPTLETAIETMKNNAFDYIKKPFNIDDLKKSIDMALLKNESKNKHNVTRIMEVGKRIKDIRKQKKMTLDKLAEKTNLSKSFLSEVERMLKYPRLSTLQVIANELEVDINLIFN